MVSADNELICRAECSKKALMSFQVEKDGVGLKVTNQQVIVLYSPGWPKINSMCLCGSSIFISQCQGVSKINLKSGECRLLVELVDEPCVLTRFGSDVLFTNQKKSSVWHLKPCGELNLFAGSDKGGTVDGPIKICRFKQPMGICTEFDSVVYVCDAQANSLMVCTEVKQTFDYQATNLLSCMALDVENCHSTVHTKQANMSAKEYSISFGVTMKESVKRVTQWRAYYHTSRKSWYPKPEETISFSKVPTMKPLLIS